MKSIEDLSFEELLKEEHFDEYQKGQKHFHSELVALNTYLFLAAKIVEFPLEVFGGPPDKQIFFRMVSASFYESTLLIISRNVTDQKGELFTLLRFKNQILEWVKDEYQKDYKAYVRQTRFDLNLRNILTRVRDIRNNRISHTTNDFVNGKVTLEHPDLNELKELRDKLNSILDVIGFDRGYIMLPLDYHPDVTSKSTTDIEKILDSLAKESYVLNMPESHPERWARRKLRMDKSKLDAINEYRQKFGLPTA